MESKSLIRLIIGGVVVLVGMMVLVAAFDLVPIKGSQVGVKETWFDGVKPDPLPPRTYFVLPWERVQEYSVAVQVFTMSGETAYLVQSKDSQDMHLSLSVQYRLDPLKIVQLHKTVGPTGIESTIITPTVQRVVKDEATTREAIEAYAGEGLKKLQDDILKELRSSVELSEHGIIVDNFVIQHIKLDPNYTTEITQRQIAVQKEMRARQEEKAATAEAAKAKAVAQADYETKLVGAKRDKEVQVTQAEADQEQAILKAEGEKQKTVLAAEAEKESAELQASAIKALGEANAEAERLKFSAYSAPGSEVYAKIEVAKSLGASLSGIKGYLPEKMQVFTLGENFMKAVENVVSGSQKPQEVK